MDPDTIAQLVAASLPGVEVVLGDEGVGAGDYFFFYDPDRALDPKQRFPFATIVTKDYEGWDCASHLNRPGTFRLNIGLSSETYRALFGLQPKPAAAGAAVATGHDFSALDQLMPHPVYASQSWVCVLNPSEGTFQTLRPLLNEAYERAVRRYTVLHAEPDPS
jgi:hypothetical protein